MASLVSLQSGALDNLSVIQAPFEAAIRPLTGARGPFPERVRCAAGRRCINAPADALYYSGCITLSA